MLPLLLRLLLLRLSQTTECPCVGWSPKEGHREMPLRSFCALREDSRHTKKAFPSNINPLYTPK